MNTPSEHLPPTRADITAEQWDTIVWLTAELSWWRNEQLRFLGDVQAMEEAMWRTVCRCPVPRDTSRSRRPIC
jgi:hypothetical protein